VTQLVVLCGGRGTRMASIVGGDQKCLVPVAGRPFLDHVLDAAARPPVDRVLLLAGHRADEITAYARARAVQVHTEAEPHGTIAALRDAADLLDDEFLLALGDVQPPVGRDLWTELSARAAETGAAAVMALAPEEASLDQGNVEVEGPWITRYDKAIAGPYVDRAVRFLTRTALRTQQGAHDQEFFGGLATRRQLAHHVLPGRIVEVGTPERWEHANRVLADQGVRP